MTSAQTAAQLDQASNGRFILGLGVADGFVVHGGADECLARASEYAAAGVDLPVLFPMPADGDWGYAKTIAALAGKIT